MQKYELPKDAQTQLSRISRMVMLYMAEHHKGVPHSIDYDVQKDRVVARIRGANLEFGPKEWFLGDRELQDLIAAWITNAVGFG
jgi:hypothetical protein